MVRTGVIGETVTLGIKFYVNGQLVDPYDVGLLRIYDEPTGGNLVATIAPTRVSLGHYQVAWSVPSSFDTGTYYDEWTWTAESDMVSNVQRYEFELVDSSSYTGDQPAALAVQAGCRPKPTWEHMIGLRVVEDVGNGMGLRLTWGKAIPSDSSNQIHYNVYYASTRIGVFANWPKAITTDQSIVLNVFEPGDLQYLAVKATEFDPTEYDISTLSQIGVGVYQYPEELELLEDIDAYGATMLVDGDNSEYPDAGYLLVGSEVIRYRAKGSGEFYIEDTDRGMISTYIETHSAGESVKLWRGVEDGNTNMMLRTAAWHYTEGTPRNVDEIGELNVDEDGYRAANIDIVTTDMTASDANVEDFPTYDYTGYHRPSLQKTFSGKCVKSYVGGEFNGGRGLFFQDRNLARLEAMIQVTGETMILLQRKWSGKRCQCPGLRREHPRTRCPVCYGTGFAGGYDRFINTRAISEFETNTQGFIMVRVHPYTDDLEIVPDQGLRQPLELTAWTLTIPTIKDRDVLVRLNEDGTEEFRYEVLDVIRNKLFFGQTGKQQFRMRRHDKTDVIYQYNAVI